jgi:predicted outer membrane protein
MNSRLLLLTVVVCAGSAFVAEAAETKKSGKSNPGKLPPIIQITPAGEPAVGKGIIQSEMGGREMQFFEEVSRAGQEQLALTELAKTKSESDQIKAIAATLASTQSAETREIERLAGEKKFVLNIPSAKGLKEEFVTLSGAKFEKAWIERIITVNQTAFDAYGNGAKSSDADVRSFSEKMLPVAKARLEMASRLGGRPVPANAPAAPAPAKP